MDLLLGKRIGPRPGTGPREEVHGEGYCPQIPLCVDIKFALCRATFLLLMALACHKGCSLLPLHHSRFFLLLFALGDLLEIL